MPDAGVFSGTRILDNTIPDAKLQTITTPGKVGNAATTATSSATASAIIARDGAGRAQVADPSAAQDIATKTYVDNAVSGARSPKDAVRLATAAALATNTRSGNILTATANGVMAAVDGVTPALNDRILVKNEVTGANHGIYSVTSVGAAGAPWQLTRAVDADDSTEVLAGMFCWATEGTANADSGWLLTTDGAIVLNTTALTFTQVSGLGQITDGAGLTKTGNSLAVNVDNSSIEISTDILRVKALGITAAMLAGSIPDTKLSTISTPGKVTNAATTATDAATASAIIARDASGRAKVVAPSAATDIANKDYVDTKFIVNEVPSGTINGINNAFTIANTPVTGSIELVLMGITLLLGTHYTVSGTTITYATDKQPASGEWHFCNYTKA